MKEIEDFEAPFVHLCIFPCRESLASALFLPATPLLLSGLLCLPVPLLHLTRSLEPVPGKSICADPTEHLTFDACAFILGYCAPVALLFFLGMGLFVR